METRGDITTVRGERYVPLTLDQPEEQKRMFRLASRPYLIPSDLESWRILKPLPATPEPLKAAKAAQPVTAPTKAKAPAHTTPETK